MVGYCQTFDQNYIPPSYRVSTSSSGPYYVHDNYSFNREPQKKNPFLLIPVIQDRVRDNRPRKAIDSTKRTSLKIISKVGNLSARS